MLEEALPLFIERKDAFHLLLKQVSADFALPVTAPSPIINTTLLNVPLHVEAHLPIFDTNSLKMTTFLVGVVGGNINQLF